LVVLFALLNKIVLSWYKFNKLATDSQRLFFVVNKVGKTNEEFF